MTKNLVLFLALAVLNTGCAGLYVNGLLTLQYKSQGKPNDKQEVKKDGEKDKLGKDRDKKGVHI